MNLKPLINKEGISEIESIAQAWGSYMIMAKATKNYEGQRAEFADYKEEILCRV